MQLKKWPNEFAQLNYQIGFEYQLEHCKTPIALVESFEKKNLKLNASQESSSKFLDANSTNLRY